jgi:threonine aldolase
MDNVSEIFAQSTNILPGHGPRKPMKEIFRSLADALEGDEFLDSYGSGAYIAGFESEIAELFGKEAAVFCPPGPWRSKSR